jgi:peptide/nickel transport system permease protein
MLGFIVRRLLSAVLVIAVASMIVFAIFFLGPSNPAQPVCDGAGGRCTPERLAAIEKAMGLDQPVTAAYGEYMKGIFAGRTIDLGGAEYDCSRPCTGISYGTREEVTDELFRRLPATVLIAIGGSITYFVLGVTLGSLAARYRGTSADRLLVGGSLLVSSIPYYLLALLAWIFLTLKTNIFPETGYFPITDDPIKTFSGLLLPCLVLGIATAPAYARFTRGQMVETISEDYIRTATAKGVTSRKVIFKHSLRAAIVPVVTIFGLDFGALLAGTIFTEKIFDIDGIGRWGLDALTSPQDLPVLTVTVMVGAFFIVLSNLVVDIIYGFLDPRVRVA